MFEKGSIPANAKPIGYEAMDAHGYIKVKVKGCKTLRFKHHVVWEQANNAVIPKGHIVRFIDGDHTNFDPSNLVCLSRAENVILNKRGFTQEPLELRHSLIAIVKLEQKLPQSHVL